MEEDIKILEDKIKISRDLFNDYGTHNYLKEPEMQMIENLIARYKELEEEKELDNGMRQLFENDMLGYIKGYEDGRNGTTGLAYKVGKQFADYTLTLRLNQYKEDYIKARNLLEDSISKSKVKEKIKKLKEEAKSERVLPLEIIEEQNRNINYKIEVLQELLED